MSSYLGKTPRAARYDSNITLLFYSEESLADRARLDRVKAAAKNGGAKLVYDLDVSCGQGTFPSAISELFCEREIMPATLLALIFRCPNVWLLSRCRAGVVALVREHQRLDRLALRRL